MIDLTTAECDIIAYVGGFLKSIMKSIDSCKSCEQVLMDSSFVE